MSHSLGQEMNAATRPLHATLNRLILSLLPLALPPHTSTPHLYAHGLSAFAPIYSTFETAFTHALTSPSTPPRLHTLLSTLHTPALERTSRLQADLALLLPLPESRSQSPQAHGPQLAALVTHIEAAVAAKPHLLLAYTWNMYMALFSGGRYLRAQLRGANTTSWHIPVEAAQTVENNADAPLQFWCFDGDEDGEDLKTEFKARVAEVEALLTEEERREVVAEGVEIMRSLIEIVRHLEAAGLEERTAVRFRIMPNYVVNMVANLSWGIAERLGYRHGAKTAVPSA